MYMRIFQCEKSIWKTKYEMTELMRRNVVACQIIKKSPWSEFFGKREFLPRRVSIKYQLWFQAFSSF
ncbi:hypothetical protein JHK86_007919 [Glycine max]|nr:hypothetical protein JHK86_007919 [Glycine max]